MAEKSPDQVVVLIVDDSVERREITRMVLAFAGIRAVVEAASVDQALQTLRDAVIDIVLVECRMAEMDGIEFVRLIRHGHDSFDSRVPIIVQTANPTRALVETARDAGINEFLVRPFSPQQVSGLSRPSSGGVGTSPSGSLPRRRGFPLSRSLLPRYRFGPSLRLLS